MIMNENHIQTKIILFVIIQILLLTLFLIKNKGKYCIMKWLIYRR